MRITKKQDQRIRRQINRINEINQYYTKEHQIKWEIKLEVTYSGGKSTTDKKEIEETLAEYEQAT